MKKLLILLSLIAPGCIPEGDSNSHQRPEEDCWSETVRAQDYVDFPCDLEVDVILCATPWGPSLELGGELHPDWHLPYLMAQECIYQ